MDDSSEDEDEPTEAGASGALEALRASGASSESTALRWTVFDYYCGLGGFTAGALSAFDQAGIGCKSIDVVGVDCDATPLDSYKRNVGKAAKVETLCRKIGTDQIEWPEENGRLIVHFSPCCQPFSRARVKPAASEVVEDGMQQIRMILDLVIQKDWKRWSIEEVSHPSIVSLVETVSKNHPSKVDFAILDAASYSCPSERRRLIVSSPKIIEKLKSLTTTDYTSPKEALNAAGITPASDFYRNGNSNCEPRMVSRPTFTITASHPLVWCNFDRSLVRCMTPRESAVLVGLPKTWILPKKSIEAQRAVGNVVSPAIAKAIVEAELSIVLEENDKEIDDDRLVTFRDAKRMISEAVDALRNEIFAKRQKR